MGPKKKRPAENTGLLPPTPRKQRKSSNLNSSVASMNIDYDLLADAILRKQNSQPGGANVQHGTNVLDSVRMANPVLTDVSCTPASTAISSSLSSVHMPQPMDSATAGAQLLPSPSESLMASSTTGPHSVPSTSESQPSGGTSSQFACRNDFTSFLQQLFSGESGASSQELSNSTLSINDGIPLGANIAGRLKQKIWPDQFIEFKSLLPNNKETTVSIQIDQNSLSFSNAASAKNQNLISIDQWTTAFFNFMAIYIEKKPQDAPHLLKYGSVIREIAANNGDAAWRYYDENFRKLRQSNNLPWQTTLSELLVSACTIHRAKQPFRSSFRNKSDKFSKFCFNFNNGTKCRSYPCPFSHLCQSCRESHPRVKCPKRKSDSTAKLGKQITNNNKRSEASM